LKGSHIMILTAIQMLWILSDIHFKIYSLKARTITLQSIVNINRVQYRNFKKVFNDMPKPSRSVIQENPKQEQE